jgi:thiosulfate dehydrogenase [quinone] large subunit
MSAANSTTAGKTILTIQDPPVARFLFADVRFSWFWLIVRLHMGYEWLTAGWAKVTSAEWVGAQSGTALTAFVNNAMQQTTGAHPNVEAWYAWFLQHIVLPEVPVWSWNVSLGELSVGVALILGIFTGLAAFFGSFMNVNYLMAGSLSINPLLFIFATWIVLAWKTAGWIGLDRWILPALGTSWRPGKLFRVGGQENQPS